MSYYIHKKRTPYYVAWDPTMGQWYWTNDVSYALTFKTQEGAENQLQLFEKSKRKDMEVLANGTDIETQGSTG